MTGRIPVELSRGSSGGRWGIQRALYVPFWESLRAFLGLSWTRPEKNDRAAHMSAGPPAAMNMASWSPLGALLTLYLALLGAILDLFWAAVGALLNDLWAMWWKTIFLKMAPSQSAAGSIEHTHAVQNSFSMGFLGGLRRRLESSWAGCGTSRRLVGGHVGPYGARLSNVGGYLAI